MKTKVFINNIDYSQYVISSSESKQFEEGYLIGNTPSTELSLKVDNSSGVFNTLLEHQITLKQDDKQLGIFNVIDKPERMTSELSLSLNDNMIKANVLYKSTLAYPCTINDQLNEMNLLFNMNIDFSMLPSSVLNRIINFYDNTVSIRIHLSWIAEMCACNVFADENGILTFVKLSKDIKHTITSDDVEKFEKIENYNISRVKFDNGLLAFEKGSVDGNTIYINSGNPYIELQEQIDFLYTELQGLSFWTVKGFKIASIDGLLLGESIEYKEKFIFIPLNIKTEYMNATYDIQEISGELKIKNAEYVNNKTSNEVKIRGIKVISDQNNAKLEIISKEQDGLNEKVGNLVIDNEHIKGTVTQINGSVYKFESGSGNIFNNCAQSITKRKGDERIVSSLDMPCYVTPSFMRGKDVCLSVSIETKNAIPRSINGFLGAEFSVSYVDGTSKTYSLYHRPGATNLSNLLSIGQINISKRMFILWKLDDKEINNISNLKITIECNGDFLYVANPKVEIGKKPTGFEFDMQEVRDNITTIETNYTSIESKVNEISLQAVSLTDEVTTIKGDVKNVQTRLQSTELKLTPTEITAMVNERIGADGELRTTKISINKDGLSVKGGGIKIFNNFNTSVFRADDAGNLILSGRIEYAQIDGANINISQDARIGNILYLGKNGDTSTYRYISLNGGVVVPNSDISGDVIAYKSGFVGMHGNRRSGVTAGTGVGGCGVTCDGDSASVSIGGPGGVRMIGPVYNNSGGLLHASDKKLKENIENIDLSPLLNDLNIYSFNYLNDKTPTVGVLANEFINSELRHYVLRYYDYQVGKKKNGSIKTKKRYAVDYQALFLGACQKIIKLENRVEKIEEELHDFKK